MEEKRPRGRPRKHPLPDPNAPKRPPGRPRKKPPIPDAMLAPHLPSEEELDMLEMLRRVALGQVEATSLQVRAAIAAVQYTHKKRHDGGAKEEVAEKAKKAATGKFGARSAPPGGTT